MKNGVKFGNMHSIDDWDLLLTNKSIESPVPKIIQVDVPGSDGMKDLTEIFGIKYNNRNLTFDFDIFSSRSDWFNLYQKIAQYLHGKKQKIILDVDSDFYYYGRCQISNFSNGHSVAHISISCDCDPYKYKLEETELTQTVSEGSIYNFPNLFREIVPKIYLSSNLTFEYEGVSYSLSAGNHEILNISLKEGNNYFKITEGSGEMKLTYQEATL